MLTIDLPEDVTERLREEFDKLQTGIGDTEQVLADLLAVGAVLPRETRRQLLFFRASPYAPSALLITGLPVESGLPPTPVEETSDPLKPAQVSDLSILTVAVLLGEPIAYRAEKNGAIVQNVFPLPSQRDTPSNESSAAPLGFHTELTFSRQFADRPFHESSPDYVLLIGLRCPAGRLASTTVVDARGVCARLGPRQIAALRVPQFQLMAPYSFTRDADGTRPWSPPVALLHGPLDAPSLAFDTACGVRPLTAEASEAITALTEACCNPELSQSVQLHAGDLLAINNRRCAHSRSAFPARFDGQDRWLQRVYVRRNIWPLPVESPGSFRVLT